ncbi:MAG TPA: nucleoside kinase [Planctomycetota bacterium]|nr:nucleoside kinase [Planctomycetota bacterium]
MKEVEKEVEKRKTVTVTLVGKEKKEELQVEVGTTLKEFFRNTIPRPAGNPVVGAKINESEVDLWYAIQENCEIKPIDLTHYSGVKVYERSLVLLVLKALEDLYPDIQLEVHHAISKGVYCEFQGENSIGNNMVQPILDHMRKLVINAVPFEKREVPLKEAIELFKKQNREDTVQLLQKSPQDTITIYSCGNSIVTFYSYTVPDASYLKNFNIMHYGSGIIIRFPEQQAPDIIPEYIEQDRLFRVFQEHKQWIKILGVDTIGKLNHICKKNKIKDFVRVSEAIQEKNIAKIADQIANDRENIRIILISGPSSSGKTTFSKRLTVHLRVNGINAVPLSLDDYFKNHEATPRDELGELNFECIETLDVTLLNQHLTDLLDNRVVEIPKYNFNEGKRSATTKKLQLQPNEIIILEGIHGLNPKLTATIPNLNKFKIYVSALIVINIDYYNRIPTTDLRIIRRIVRDNQFRGYSATDTLKRWNSIRRGENENIFPYQNYANVMFNSAMAYELAVLKNFVTPLLEKIQPDSSVYSEAVRLLTFLAYFESASSDIVPDNSILREFIGGSSFKY